MVNLLSSLKPVPNTNLFNSVLLWSLASAFGHEEHFGPSYPVVSVVFTSGNWFQGYYLCLNLAWLITFI